MMRKGVRACERGKGHVTIIGLMMNTISPRTLSSATGTLARAGVGSVWSPQHN